MSFLGSWLSPRDVTDRPYALIVGHGPANSSAPVELGALLHSGLLEVSYVARVLGQYGHEGVRQYLDARGFRGKLNKRVGDLGEVLAGTIICDHESLVQPISKLRYRERSDWAMRLTDVFTIRMVDGDISEFDFASVKSGITKPPTGIAVQGYEQLQDDAEIERPEILFFSSEQLYRQGHYKTLTRFEEAINSTEPVPKSAFGKFRHEGERGG